jgi:hypothetical protein
MSEFMLIAAGFVLGVVLAGLLHLRFQIFGPDEHEKTSVADSELVNSTVVAEVISLCLDDVRRDVDDMRDSVDSVARNLSDRRIGAAVDILLGGGTQEFFAAHSERLGSVSRHIRAAQLSAIRRFPKLRQDKKL